MFQKDMITLTVAVEFNGYVVVIPALSLRYKHRDSVPGMQLLASTSLTYIKWYDLITLDWQRAVTKLGVWQEN